MDTESRILNEKVVCIQSFTPPGSFSGFENGETYQLRVYGMTLYVWNDKMGVVLRTYNEYFDITERKIKHLSWSPKKGEKVYVASEEDGTYELRKFVVEHDGYFWCEAKVEKYKMLLPWKFIKRSEFI